MYTFKRWLSKCGPEWNVAEDGPLEQLCNAHHSHFLLPAAEMNGDKNDTM